MLKTEHRQDYELAAILTDEYKLLREEVDINDKSNDKRRSVAFGS